MSASAWIRRSHRWVSMAFTATVLANVAAMILAGGAPPPWLAYSPLLPLLVLQLTGLWLFFLPYVGKRRSAGRIEP